MTSLLDTLYRTMSSEQNFNPVSTGPHQQNSTGNGIFTSSASVEGPSSHGSSVSNGRSYTPLSQSPLKSSVLSPGPAYPTRDPHSSRSAFTSKQHSCNSPADKSIIQPSMASQSSQPDSNFSRSLYNQSSTSIESPPFQQFLTLPLLSTCYSSSSQSISSLDQSSTSNATHHFSQLSPVHPALNPSNLTKPDDVMDPQKIASKMLEILDSLNDRTSSSDASSSSLSSSESSSSSASSSSSQTSSSMFSFLEGNNREVRGHNPRKRKGLSESENVDLNGLPDPAFAEISLQQQRIQLAQELFKEVHKSRDKIEVLNFQMDQLKKQRDKEISTYNNLAAMTNDIGVAMGYNFLVPRMYTREDNLVNTIALTIMKYKETT